MTLKLSSFTLLNDLNEDDLNCERSGGMDFIDIQNYIREHCRLICFTQNFERKGDFKCHTGCNHPRMWAQYADNSQGACLVINEKEFLKRNTKAFEGKFHKIANVDYSSSLFNKNIKTHTDEGGFIQKNWEHLFFNKYIDWEHEHICHGPQVLAVAGVLLGVNTTGVSKIKNELSEAGAIYKDVELVVDGNLITSRGPDDLPVFVKAIEDALDLSN